MRIRLERVDTQKGSQLWIHTTFRNASRRVHGPVKFIVDTGAMRTVIAYDQAVKLNINVDSLRNPTISMGISEQVNTYPFNHNRLYVKWSDDTGDHLFKTFIDVGIIENPGRGLFNLLGLDFIIQHNARLIVDCENEEYYLEIPE